MKSTNLPMQIHELAFLKAYLYELFTSANVCQNNFHHTNWYLKDKYSDDEIEKIKNHFILKNINCDCDIIFKLDLRRELKTIKSFH